MNIDEIITRMTEPDEIEQEVVDQDQESPPEPSEETPDEEGSPTEELDGEDVPSEETPDEDGAPTEELDRGDIPPEETPDTEHVTLTEDHWLDAPEQETIPEESLSVDAPESTDDAIDEMPDSGSQAADERPPETGDEAVEAENLDVEFSQFSGDEESLSIDMDSLGSDPTLEFDFPEFGEDQLAFDMPSMQPVKDEGGKPNGEWNVTAKLPDGWQQELSQTIQQQMTETQTIVNSHLDDELSRSLYQLDIMGSD